MTTPRFIVSYFDGFNPIRVDADLDDIKQSGFDAVLFPVSEEQARFQADNIADCVLMARNKGLETWLSPWGVAGLFGGEGLSAVDTRCTNDHEVWAVVDRWLDVALAAKPDAIMLDEPRSRCCDIRELIEDIVAKIVGRFVEVHFCLDGRDEWPISELSAALASGIGIDPYWIPHRRDDPLVYVHEQMQRLATVLSSDGVAAEMHVWVQGFRVPQADVGMIVETIHYLAAQEVPLIGIWGYRGSESMSALVCENPVLTWNAILQAVDFVKKWIR